MAQPSTVAGFPLACHAEAYASPARTEVMSILQTQPDAKEWSERDERHGVQPRGSGGAQRALPTYKSALKKCIPCASPAILARKNTTSYFN